MNFKEFDLDARILSSIERAGYVTPTQIQKSAIPKAISGRDILGIAQTGTGKTVAFVLPILQKLLACPRGSARALILAPTRELAEQTLDVSRMLSFGTGIRSAAIYGGVGAAPQIKALRDCTEILVACPGRLLDILTQVRTGLDNVTTLVLDEADRLFDMGFLPDVKRIISNLPSARQTMLFSATLPREIEKLASFALKNPARVEIGIRAPVATVSHALYPVPQHLKLSMLLALLEETSVESVLIFTRTKHKADRVATRIKQIGLKAARIHSNRTQSQRQAALSGFKNGRYKVLVATDIAARGIDVEHITHVINFDMPDCPDSYIHRIGRTGRAERTGSALTLVTPEDEESVRELEKIMGKKLARKLLPDFDYMQEGTSGCIRANVVKTVKKATGFSRSFDRGYSSRPKKSFSRGQRHARSA